MDGDHCDEARLQVAARQHGVDLAFGPEVRTGDLLLVRLQRLIDHRAERQQAPITGGTLSQKDGGPAGASPVRIATTATRGGCRWRSYWLIRGRPSRARRTSR